MRVQFSISSNKKLNSHIYSLSIDISYKSTPTNYAKMTTIEGILAQKQVPYYVRPLIWRHIGRPDPIELSITAGYALMRRWEKACIDQTLCYEDDDSSVKYASQHGLQLLDMLPKTDAPRFIRVMLHDIRLLLSPSTVKIEKEGNRLFYDKHVGKKTSRAVYGVDPHVLCDAIRESNEYTETRDAMKKRLRFYERGLLSARAILSMDEEALSWVLR